MISLPPHPFPDVWRTLQDRDARRLTLVQEANAIDIHQIDLLQIQGYWLSSTLYFRLHLAEVLRSKLAAKANPRSALPEIRSIFSIVRLRT